MCGAGALARETLGKVNGRGRGRPRHTKIGSEDDGQERSRHLHSRRVLGVCAGVLDVKVGDLLLTALFVLAATMLLGALRPQRPWRWTLTVAVFVPLVQLAAFALLTEKPYRAQIYESFLGFLTGIAGAYGGATARRGMEILFGEVRSEISVSSQLSRNTLILMSAAAIRRNSTREIVVLPCGPRVNPFHCRPRLS